MSDIEKSQTPSPKHSWAIIARVILIMAILALIVNFPYFWQNIKFIVNKPPTPTETNTESKIEPNILIIDSLGLKLPVIITAETSEDGFQKDLQRGVVHYPGTALAGQPGNVYIFGHSSDYLWSPGHYKTAFALLPRINIGDEIILSNEQGTAFRYKVFETKVVTPDDLSVLDQYNYEKQLLTLQTSYPVGTALKRYIVKAELAD